MALSDVFSLIAAAHNVFLIVLLQRFSGTYSNKLLILLLLSISLCLCADLWMYSGIAYQFPQLAQILSPFYLVIGPLLYLYVCSSLKIFSSNKFFVLLHGAPAMLFALLLFLVAISASTQELRVYLLEDRNTTGVDGFGVAIQIHVGVYIFASIWRWYQFDRAVKAEFSADIVSTMRWLKQALSIFLVMWSIWFAGDLISDTAYAPITDFAMVIGIYFLGYSALLHRNIVLPPVLSESPAQVEASAYTENPQSQRYARAKLSGERATQLKKALDELMNTERPYLDGDLTLSSLSHSLAATNHEISQLLNEEMAVSFFDFINRYRVQEVQRCLSDPAYALQSLLEIGLASGFNSKAAFNAAFKRFTGVTPSEWRKTSGL